MEPGLQRGTAKVRLAPGEKVIPLTEYIPDLEGEHYCEKCGHRDRYRHVHLSDDLQENE